MSLLLSYRHTGDIIAGIIANLNRKKERQLCIVTAVTAVLMEIVNASRHAGGMPATYRRRQTYQRRQTYRPMQTYRRHAGQGKLPMYNGFASENAVKEVLTSRHPRESFTLATKHHAGFVHSLEDRDKVFNAQLEKTGAGYFDYYLIHGIEAGMLPVYEKYDCFNWLRAKKAEGLVKHAGFSFHDQPELLEQILTKHLFTAIIFACSLGTVTALIAVPQAAILLLLFFCARVIFPLTTPSMVNDFKACGGLIMLATGFRIAKIADFPIADMIPAMILIWPVSWMWTGVCF